MCFSAEASFAAGAILLGIGVVSLNKAVSVPQRVLAGIPLLFSIQQFDEGILWLTFSNPAYMHWRQPAILTFLFFAQVVWPVFVPLSMTLIEKDPLRKRILRLTLVTGILLAAYLFYCLFTYDVTAAVSDHHIKYEFTYPYIPGWYSGLLYLIPTVVSPLVSGNKKMRMTGLIILMSFLVSKVYYGEYLTSVWCYFAAVISIMILLVVIELRKAEKGAGSRYSTIH